MTFREQLSDAQTRLDNGVDIFETYYAGKPGAGWEIDGPQPAFAELARENEFRGRVLDLGCGSGENALMTAALGLDGRGRRAERNRDRRTQGARAWPSGPVPCP